MTSLENQENQIYHECKKQKDIVGWLYIYIHTHTHTHVLSLKVIPDTKIQYSKEDV